MLSISVRDSFLYLLRVTYTHTTNIALYNNLYINIIMTRLSLLIFLSRTLSRATRFQWRGTAFDKKKTMKLYKKETFTLSSKKNSNCLLICLFQVLSCKIKKKVKKRQLLHWIQLIFILIFVSFYFIKCYTYDCISIKN